jgi:hypothetical protein
MVFTSPYFFLSRVDEMWNVSTAWCSFSFSQIDQINKSEKEIVLHTMAVGK